MAIEIEPTKPPAIVDPAPDWNQTIDDVHCPLCEYNLRGLSEPRCPECGFKFDWKELIESTRNVHPYLFEHQAKRNIWSFWKTFWRDCRPRRFWSEVHPGHAVKPRRLMIYWGLASSFLLALLLPPAIHEVMSFPNFRGVSIIPFGRTYQPPSLWSVGGLGLAWDHIDWNEAPFGMMLTFLAWPWLTISALMIFQVSMRKKNIRKTQVLRCVVYCCDFPLLVIFTAAIAFEPSDRFNADAALEAMMLCAVVTLYRLSIAYRRYLRFDRPFLTVLSSQIIVALAVFTTIVNVAMRWWWWI